MTKKIEAWIQKEISSPQYHGCRVAYKENSHLRHLVTLGLKSVGEGGEGAHKSQHLTLAYSLKEVNAALSYATGANPQPRILHRGRELG